MRAYLDANVFVFAALDTGQKGELSRDYLERTTQGKIEAATSALTLDEILWVLLRNHRPDYLRPVIEGIYALPNCTILPVTADAPRLALEFIEKYKIKPRDALHAAIMQQHHLNNIISDDTDFDKIAQIKRHF